MSGATPAARTTDYAFCHSDNIVAHYSLARCGARLRTAARPRLNPPAGKIYVTNGVLIGLVDAGTLSVTESRALLNAKGLLSMVVSPSSGHIYGIIPDGPLIVLDGDSMAIVATISVPEGVSGIAI